MVIRQWVKNHKKEFTNRFIRESGAIPNPKEPVCVFMAGLPGAGKTEYTKTIIDGFHMAVIRIDMDEIATMIDSYTPEKADLFREGATSLQNDIYEKSRKNYYPFIMDGTLSNKKTLKSIKTTLNKGYTVKVAYVKQDPIVAWRNTKEREKIEHRSIDQNGFIDSYANTINNLRDIKMMGSVMIDIIIKNEKNMTVEKIVNATDAEFDKHVKIEYNNSELKGLLNA